MEKRPIGASRLPTVRITGTQADPRRAARDAGPFVLGRYALRRRLGSGAFGTVWLARDERLDRDVAVKIVPRERISEGRFEREARAAAQLSHPGIVTLYEAAIDDEGAYLVSELVRGDTLAVALEDGRLSDRDIVRIGSALCDALAHAHAHGVVHRDLKPSNVLLPDAPTSDAGVVKLTDFGVARLIGEDRLTLTGDVIGTAAYMAPEQAEGRVAGVEADLYSLALVLYEALTGLNPVATAPPAQRARRLAVHLPPLRRQRRDLPRELGQGIDLALRPRARERGTVAELARALSVSLIQVGDAPGVVASPWPKSTRPLRSRDHAPDEARWRDRLSSDWTRDRDRDRPASEAEGRQPAPSDPWPARAAAAAVTAILAAWLASHVLAPSALAPAAAAVVAALAVAALPRLGWVALALLGAGVLVAQGTGRRRLGAPVRGPVARDPAAAQPDDVAAVGGRPGARRPQPRRRLAGDRGEGRQPLAPCGARRSPAGSGWRSPRRWRTPTCTRAGRAATPRRVGLDAVPAAGRRSRPGAACEHRIRTLRPGLGGRRRGASTAGGAAPIPGRAGAGHGLVGDGCVCDRYIPRCQPLSRRWNACHRGARRNRRRDRRACAGGPQKLA